MKKKRVDPEILIADNWGYQLQGKTHTVAALAAKQHDMLVIDSTRDGKNAFSAEEVAEIKGDRSVLASYISIGEADDYRNFWDKGWTTTGEASGRLTNKAPDWLGPVNPDWPESRKVRYWDDDWQDIMFNDDRTGDFDKIVAAGFDAAYLDIVDAYYFWGAEVKDKQREAGDPKNEKQAAQRMVDFIVDMAEHAREENPDFFMIPQNGGWIIDALKGGSKADKARIEAYRDVVGAIAIEDLYFRGGNKDENNKFKPDEQLIKVLQRDFLDKGIPVYVVDYITGSKRIEKFEKAALADGFIPYAAPDRDLDRMRAPYDADNGRQAGADHKIAMIDDFMF
ncbi:MJ1477/TM1410 family putative glycoside hydrolase [Rhizobium sp.]